jgi:hypothetical protein
MYAYVGADPVNLRDPDGLRARTEPPRPPKPQNGNGVKMKGGKLDGQTRRVIDGNRPTLFSNSMGTYGYDSQGNMTYVSINTGWIAAGLTGAGFTMAERSAGISDPCNSPLPDGKTVNQNVDLMRDILREAEQIDTQLGMPYAGTASAYGVWVGLVAEGGFWDYKRQPGGTPPMGNVNYGATGSLLFPLDILRRGAGAVQDAQEKGSGSPLDLSESNYRDDPADVPYIIQGAKQCGGN